MQTKAVARFIRISPRKARQVIDLIRGKNVTEAFAILKFTAHKGTESIYKVLKSAVANAEHNNNMSSDSLYVKEAYVDAGPSFKRIMPRAMGRADIIRKRTSHITVVVDEKEEKKAVEKKTAKKPGKTVKASDKTAAKKKTAKTETAAASEKTPAAGKKAKAAGKTATAAGKKAKKEGNE